MTISSLSLLNGATITPTGGTAEAYNAGSPSSSNSVIAYCEADQDLRSQRTIEFSAVRPKASASAPNGYTQSRVNIFVKEPFALDNGAVTTHTTTIKMANDAEATQAEILERRKQAAQILLSAELDDFFYNLSTA